MPVDVLQVTGGQDHGARFGLRGSSATIGRGPVMDVVLTDPRVSRRHARVRVQGARLLVEDLASGSGIAVNGTPISEPTALAAGDRLTIGATEITVLWTPTGSREPAPREPAPAPARPMAVPAPRRPDPAPATVPAPAAPLARAEVLLPVVCLILVGFGLLALAMPALRDSSGTDSIWTLEPSGLRVQALLAALVTAVAAALWLWQALGGPRPDAVPALAGATALGGGLITGLPLLLAALDLPGVSARAGLGLLVFSGVAIAACALAGLVGHAGPPARLPEDPTGATVLAGGGVAGSVLAAVACPMTWISAGDLSLGGLSDGLAAGGRLLPLVLAVAGGCVLTLAVGRAGAARRAQQLAVATTALSAATATYATAAAIGLRSYQMEAGLSLALAGTAIAFVTILVGTATLVLDRAEAGPRA